MSSTRKDRQIGADPSATATHLPRAESRQGCRDVDDKRARVNVDSVETDQSRGNAQIRIQKYRATARCHDFDDLGRAGRQQIVDQRPRRRVQLSRSRQRLRSRCETRRSAECFRRARCGPTIHVVIRSETLRTTQRNGAINRTQRLQRTGDDSGADSRGFERQSSWASLHRPAIAVATSPARQSNRLSLRRTGRPECRSCLQSRRR